MQFYNLIPECFPSPHRDTLLDLSVMSRLHVSYLLFEADTWLLFRTFHHCSPLESQRCLGVYEVTANNDINPLNPELNPICYLLALLGAYHFLHVSRIRVKSLTFRLLMSYIYIYIYMTLVA